jgi:hypothetical protein
MRPAMQPNRTFAVLGFCPPSFRPDFQFLFIPVRAMFSAQQWLPVSSAEAQFPPSGAIFVPRRLFPPSYHPGQPAAWHVVDQPDWQRDHLGARYSADRAIDSPAEVLPVPCRSDDYEAARQLLLHEGLDHSSRLDGYAVLLEFTDGVVAGPFAFTARPGAPGRYLCSEQSLRHPLPAWPANALQRLVLTVEGSRRVFASQETRPAAAQYLDFASLEAMLQGARTGAGAPGSGLPADIDVEGLAGSLRQVLASYLAGPMWQARHDRLKQLLDHALQADSARRQWEEYLRQHPTFDRAVRATIEGMREQLRQEARAEAEAGVKGLRERIGELQTQRRQEEEMLQRTRQELTRLREERERLTREAGPLWGEVPARAAEEFAGSTTAVLPLPQPAAPAGPLCWEMIEGLRPRLLTSAAEAVDHLAENCERLGLLAESARQLAREVFTAANLGQALFFRGSFALPLAEVAASSLAGGRWCRLSVPAGLSTALTLPPRDGAARVAALVLEGINRSCFDACGAALARLLQERALGLRGRRPPVPVLLATLLDGPSSLPPGPSLLTFGPVFHGDYLAWKDALAATPPEPGECALPAWEVTIAPSCAADLLDGLERLPNVQWERNVSAAGGLLAGLGEDGVGPSLLCGWILPYLLAGRAPGELPEATRQRWREHARDPRLARLLRAHQLGLDP